MKWCKMVWNIVECCGISPHYSRVTGMKSDVFFSLLQSELLLLVNFHSSVVTVGSSPSLSAKH